MATPFDQIYLPADGLHGQEEDFNFGNAYQNTSFTPINGLPDLTNGTISPQDLFHDSMVMSAPPSGAFPNLDTPDTGYLESPDMASSGLNTSPLDEFIDATSYENYTPLFPDCGDQFAQGPLADNHLQLSFNSHSSNSAAPSPMVRQKSSPGRPPITGTDHLRKLSSASGIQKSKSRRSLPEIQVESEDDSQTAKRKKNTAAARKSRQRKQEVQNAMECEIQRLRAMIYRLGGDPDASL